MQVTILIPCYNGSNFLNRCIDSCIKQTYKNIKILIVNDGSTDNSEQIINDYIKKHNNIRLINQSNKGLSSTRNVLLKNMETKLGFFLDVDDWIDEDCIETFIKNYNNNALVVNSCFINKKNKDKVFYITNKISRKTNNQDYLINNTPFAWGFLFDKNIFFENNILFCEKSQFFEDAGIISYLIYKNKNISFINKPKYHYFINKNSLSREKMNYKKINNAIMQLNNFYELIKNENFNSLPKCLNDQLAFYHCVIFTYIEFQSKLSNDEKRKLKNELRSLEQNNFKLHVPKRYWKKWYFYLYRLYWY